MKAGDCQQRLHFGGEVERSGLLGVEERAHAHPVAGNKHPLGTAIPDREGEIAVKAREAFRTVDLIELQQDFRITTGAEAMAPRDQLFAQLDIIENFAVEGDGKLAVIGHHRLGAVGETDDGKPDMGEARTGCRTFRRHDFQAAAIGSAMGNRVAHGNQKPLRLSHMTQISRKTAHARIRVQDRTRL